jgi:hypothetical protein
MDHVVPVTYIGKPKLKVLRYSSLFQSLAPKLYIRNSVKKFRFDNRNLRVSAVLTKASVSMENIEIVIIEK